MLLERDEELAVLDSALGDARAGRGSLVVVEGAAGAGKTRLLEEAAGHDHDASCCLRGRGAELEREMPFGVARQLLRPAVWALEGRERERLLGGLAAEAAGLLGTEDATRAVPADPAALVDALYWLVYALTHDGADSSHALLVVDDAQWADAASVRMLLRLAVGLDELPVALVVAVRTGELDRTGPLAMLRAHPDAHVLRPAALSYDAVGAIVRTGLGEDAAPELLRECAAVTGGNPFLVCELVSSLRADGVEPTARVAEGLTGMVPESVLRSVLLRLARLPAAAGALAEACSVLGPGVRLHVAARVARLEAREAEQAADALVGSGVLRTADPLTFEHPLIASAVASDASPDALARAHRRAAGVLADEGASDERLAAHLRLAPAGADPWVAEVLRRAAAVALARGEARGAARLLERAVAEPPPPGERPAAALELAEAEAACGDPQAVRRLAEASDTSHEPERRARTLQAMARLLFARGEVHAAVEAAEQGRALLHPDDPLAIRILASQLAIMYFVPDAWPRAERHLAELEALWEAGRLPQDPLVLSQLATRRGVWVGEGPQRVRSLAEACLDLTVGPGEVWQGDAGMACALVYVGETDLAERLLERMSTYATRTGSPIHAGMAATWRAVLRLQQGWVADAAADADSVLATYDEHWGFQAGWVAAVLAQARLELGDPEGARAAIEAGARMDARQLTYAFLLHARGETMLAAGDAARALADFEAAGAHARDRYALDNPSVLPWRTGAVRALVALGAHARAQELAAAEVEHARSTGVAHAHGAALRAAAEAAGDGAERVALLREAVAVLGPSGARLEYARSLADLGAAQRRGRDRSGARVALEDALAVARGLGMTETAGRAYRELRLTGARPSPGSGDRHADALTPGERRVAELAAQDLSNAQIAKQLFVTLRTVEWHLTQTYRKLGIRSRAGLARALRPVSSDG